MLYFYSGDEYFLSSIVSYGNLTEEKDVGGFTRDEHVLFQSSCMGERLRMITRTTPFSM